MKRTEHTANLALVPIRRPSWQEPSRCTRRPRHWTDRYSTRTLRWGAVGFVVAFWAAIILVGVNV